MARADTHTWLSLDEWARVMGYSRWHFNGVTGFDCNVGTQCAGMWYQYPEQLPDYVTRDELAMAIREAEDRISELVGYNLLPDWNYDRKRPPAFYDPRYQSNVSATGHPKSVKLNRRYVRALGQRAKTLITAGINVAFVDHDGDGFAETARITVAVPDDINELRVYYPGESGDDSWEIRPIKVVNSTTVEFPVWQIVRPEFSEYSVCVDIQDPEADIYLRTVDAYRVYNSTAATQVELVYNPNPGCTGDCSKVSITNCGYVEDWKLGYVVYNPVLYQEPDEMVLYYYSGHTAERGTARPLVELDPYWVRPVAYLAGSLLEKQFRDCCGSESPFTLNKWTQDLILRDKDDPQRVTVTQFIVENPLGVVTEGAWYAYQKILARL